MKKLVLLLLCAGFGFIACNESGESKTVTKDSVTKSTADSVAYNPAEPASQNSDDPARFSQ